MADPAADDKTKVNGEEPKKEESSEKPAENSEDKTDEDKQKDEMVDSPAPENKPKTKKVLKPVKIDLNVSSEINGKLSKSTLQNYIECENNLCVLDKKEKDRQDAKNEVESFIYESREKMSTMYGDFATEEEKSKISTDLENGENWLYEDGYDEKRQAYLDKYTSLNFLISPIKQRYSEANSRGPAIDSLQKYIVKVDNFLKNYRNGDENLVHIDIEKVNLVEKSLNEIREWANSSIVKISQMSKTSNPEILTSAFNDKLGQLRLASKSTMETPKPKPKKEENPKDEENKAEENKENQNGEDLKNKKDNSEQVKTEEPQVNGAGDVNDMDLD